MLLLWKASSFIGGISLKHLTSYFLIPVVLNLASITFLQLSLPLTKGGPQLEWFFS